MEILFKNKLECFLSLTFFCNSKYYWKYILFYIRKIFRPIVWNFFTFLISIDTWDLICITKSNTNTIGRSPLTYGKQSEGTSVKDFTKQNSVKLYGHPFRNFVIIIIIIHAYFSNFLYCFRCLIIEWKRTLR